MINAVQHSLWMREMFDSVPRKYPLLNKIITFGRDNAWRDSVLSIIKPQEGLCILDICTGTGDLALKIANKFPSAEVSAIDFSSNMLAMAIAKADNLGIRNVTFKENDCTDMDFESNSFDYVTISFGFRNLSFSATNLKNALAEVYRVLKEGGRFIILETSQPENSFIRKIFHFYVKMAVPRAGMFIAGDKMPYAYLGGSIVKFFDENSLDCLLTSEGFRLESSKPFMCRAVRLSAFRKYKA